jgi:hypothetical protein
MRDSAGDPGVMLTFEVAAWRSFVDDVRAGEFGCA